MRTLLTFLLMLISLPAINQVKLVVNMVNDSTGTLTKKTEVSKAVFLSEGSIYEEYMGQCTSPQISFTLASDDSIIYFYIFTYRFTGSCLSELEGNAEIKFTDGTTLDCVQRSKTDCSENPGAIYLAISRDFAERSSAMAVLKRNYEKLANVPVAKIRIFGTDGFQDYGPNIKFAQFPAQNLFIEHLKALKQ
jgi:hypothetical protein